MQTGFSGGSWPGWLYKTTRSGSACGYSKECVDRFTDAMVSCKSEMIYETLREFDGAV